MNVSDDLIDRLALQAKSGDVDAFGALFDLLHPSVYRYLAGRTRQTADAEDLTQVVFMKALAAIPRYQVRGLPLRAWLFRLARNALIDFERTRRTHDRLEVPDPSDGHTHCSAQDPAPEDVVMARYESAAIRRALTALTDDQREVVALRFFGGLSPQEAAAVMGRSEGTIRGLQFRALAAIRRELARQQAAWRSEPSRHSISRVRWRTEQA
jgi:RNA polymerase sigma-70 factor (ECF subfamily)